MAAELTCCQLSKIVRENLEEATFIFAEPREEDYEWPSEICLVTLAFKGAVNGTFVMVTSTDFAALLAANFLGVDPGDEARARAADALGEMLNLIAGQVVGEALKVESGCTLDAPQATMISAGEWASLNHTKYNSPKCTTSLMAEECHRLDVFAFIDEG